MSNPHSLFRCTRKLNKQMLASKNFQQNDLLFINDSYNFNQWILIFPLQIYMAFLYKFLYFHIFQILQNTKFDIIILIPIKERLVNIISQHPLNRATSDIIQFQTIKFSRDFQFRMVRYSKNSELLCNPDCIQGKKFKQQYKKMKQFMIIKQVNLVKIIDSFLKTNLNTAAQFYALSQKSSASFEKSRKQRELKNANSNKILGSSKECTKRMINNIDQLKGILIGSFQDQIQKIQENIKYQLKVICLDYEELVRHQLQKLKQELTKTAQDVDEQLNRLQGSMESRSDGNRQERLDWISSAMYLPYQKAEGYSIIFKMIEPKSKFIQHLQMSLQTNNNRSLNPQVRESISINCDSTKCNQLWKVIKLIGYRKGSNQNQQSLRNSQLNHTFDVNRRNQNQNYVQSSMFSQRPRDQSLQTIKESWVRVDPENGVPQEQIIAFFQDRMGQIKEKIIGNLLNLKPQIESWLNPQATNDLILQTETRYQVQMERVRCQISQQRENNMIQQNRDQYENGDQYENREQQQDEQLGESVLHRQQDEQLGESVLHRQQDEQVGESVLHCQQDQTQQVQYSNKEQRQNELKAVNQNQKQLKTANYQQQIKQNLQNSKIQWKQYIIERRQKHERESKSKKSDKNSQNQNLQLKSSEQKQAIAQEERQIKNHQERLNQEEKQLKLKQELQKAQRLRQQCIIQRRNMEQPAYQNHNHSTNNTNLDTNMSEEALYINPKNFTDEQIRLQFQLIQEIKDKWAIASYDEPNLAQNTFQQQLNDSILQFALNQSLVMNTQNTRITNIVVSNPVSRTTQNLFMRNNLPESNTLEFNPSSNTLFGSAQQMISHIAIKDYTHNISTPSNYAQNNFSGRSLPSFSINQGNRGFQSQFMDSQSEQNGSDQSLQEYLNDLQKIFQGSSFSIQSTNSDMFGIFQDDYPDGGQINFRTLNNRQVPTRSIRDIHSNANSLQAQKQEFNIVVKVICPVLLTFRRRRDNHQSFPMVKLIVGDSTGIAIIYMNYFCEIRAGMCVQLNKCRLFRYLDSSYQINHLSGARNIKLLGGQTIPYVKQQSKLSLIARNLQNKFIYTMKCSFNDPLETYIRNFIRPNGFTREGRKPLILTVCKILSRQNNKYVLGDYTGRIKADLTQCKYGQFNEGDALLIRQAKIVNLHNQLLLLIDMRSYVLKADIRLKFFHDMKFIPNVFFN